MEWNVATFRFLKALRRVCVRIQQLAFHFYHGQFSIHRLVKCKQCIWAFHSKHSVSSDFSFSLEIECKTVDVQFALIFDLKGFEWFQKINIFNENVNDEKFTIKNE